MTHHICKMLAGSHEITEQNKVHDSNSDYYPHIYLLSHSSVSEKGHAHAAYQCQKDTEEGEIINKRHFMHSLNPPDVCQPLTAFFPTLYFLFLP